VSKNLKNQFNSSSLLFLKKKKILAHIELEIMDPDYQGEIYHRARACANVLV